MKLIVRILREFFGQHRVKVVRRSRLPAGGSLSQLVEAAGGGDAGQLAGAAGRRGDVAVHRVWGNVTAVNKLMHGKLTLR